IVGAIGGLPACTFRRSAESVALLTLPTQCSGEALQTSGVGDSWQAPDILTSFTAAEPLPVLTGCDRLPFDPTASVLLEQHAASSPSGLTSDIHLPQQSTLAPNGLAEGALRGVEVPLPRGVQVNPAAAGGLEGCTTSQIGYLGMSDGTQQFTPGAASCPDAAKVGAVDDVRTPLLAAPLHGALYLATPHENPFGSLVSLYLVAEDPAAGVRVKLAGNVHLDLASGQVSVRFDTSPQVPVEEIKVHVFGGPKASLTTPQQCGSYPTVTQLTTWSGPLVSESSSSSQLLTGPNGGPCAASTPFAPQFTAGTTANVAGATAPVLTKIPRADGEGTLSGLRIDLPTGLLGDVSSVAQCPEPAAQQGTCGAASLIGRLSADVGVGSEPFTESGGQVFLTGPYAGAPFGLSITVPAKAGPFDLGTGPCDCIVVRARVEVDPHTAAISILSDPLPTLLQGVPVDLRRINVAVDRERFTRNATGCLPKHILATLTSAEGATATDLVPYSAVNCAGLRFAPKFSALVEGKASKAGGAYLHVKVVSKGGPQPGGGEANIRSVKVDLPLQLPSRLSTLQKACVAVVFEANPANCPAASVVGEGTAVTPVLRSALTGPAILVSHGGEAFPDLVIVLQGEGITLDLVGNTKIKKGITSSTFKSVPDAPISTFDLVLPEGPHSV